ncbi:MAG: hypothetical protein HY720_06540 [Planctomycetes bacterium]|nr:hypothetical protein [Planctomycetota bacterium]
MRLVHTLAIDLAGTKSGKTKPAGVLLSLVHRATGLFAVDLEREVETMLSLLDSVHQSLVATGVDNLIRLAADSEVVYEDHDHEDGDLARAIERAVEKGLSGATRLQLVMEHAADSAELVLSIDVYPVHLPGAYPVWIRVAALPREFLRAKRERRDRYRRRVERALADEGERARVQGATGESVDRILSSLSKALRSRLAVHEIHEDRRWSFLGTDEDYFLGLRADRLEAIDALRAAVQKLRLDRSEARGIPLPDFLREGERMIRKTEARLVPAAGSGGSGTAFTWDAFARKMVFDPRRGKLAPIRDLPPRQQAPFRALFDSQALDARERVGSGENLVARMFSLAGRGLTSAVRATLAGAGKKAPRTKAFLTDPAYRRAALGETAKLSGKELHDQADILAHALLGEIAETARLPLAWYSGTCKMTQDEKDLKRQDDALEQILDLLELAAGTLVPLALWSAGGPLAGVASLAAIKLFQKALNWHSRKHGGRQWTIRPSRMIDRTRRVQEKRRPERDAARARLEAIRTGEPPPDKTAAGVARARIEGDLAGTLREFGKMLQEKKVEFTPEDLSLDSFKEQDLLVAVAEEARARPSKPEA